MPTALIVEDEPDANRLLAMLVQLHGYLTESAFTGGEALELVGRQAPDIVFLDLMLPDINGYEVCRTLKSMKETSLIPVVMVTARVAAENRLQSYRVGADDYIAKPYTPDQIFKAMDAADHWRRKVESGERAGEFPIDPRTPGETLRQLAKLRSLLLSGTVLDIDSVSRIDEALKEIAGEAAGTKPPVPVVGSLAYRLGDDRLVLTFRDTNGWLRDNHDAPAERWPKALGSARFDSIEWDESGSRLTLSRRYAPGD